MLASCQSVRVTRFLTAAAVLLLPPAIQTQEAPPIKVDVQFVSLTATVEDDQGHTIGNLPQEAFEIYEDECGSRSRSFIMTRACQSVLGFCSIPVAVWWTRSMASGTR